MSETISTGHDPDEGTLPWYRKMYLACKIDKGYEKAVLKDAKLVLQGKHRYEAVSKLTHVPWWVIGIIHFKEASCDFRACLHNGERIIGTGKKTTIVPIGRGPFATWEEAALDALKTERIGRLTQWELGSILYALERYNGTGYIGKHPEKKPIPGVAAAETSPYLWARTNVNDDYGKYVSDGKFSSKQTTQKTSGICAILKSIELNFSNEIELKIDGLV